MTLNLSCAPDRSHVQVDEAWLRGASEVFAPHAEDHILRARDAGVLMSRPRALPIPSSTWSSFCTRERWSYYSGITDACITFVVASQHILLTLNASLSRPYEREIVIKS